MIRRWSIRRSVRSLHGWKKTYLNTAKRYQRAKRQIERATQLTRIRNGSLSDPVFLRELLRPVWLQDNAPGSFDSHRSHCSLSLRSGRQSKKLRGRLRAPFRFDVKSCYFFLLFFFAFFLVAMFLFSLSIFHGCAVLSKKPQLMNVWRG